MRTLFFVVAVLAALYAGYWFLGSSQIETRAGAALAELETRGWDVDYSALSTTGFPTRFDTNLTDLRIESSDGSLVWEAPSFLVSALGYRPNRVVAVWPPEQRLTLSGQSLDISSAGLDASATMGLSLALPLERATLGSGTAEVAAEGGWSAGLDRLSATAERTGPATYDLLAEAEGLRSSTIDAQIGLLRLDAQLTLGAPVVLRGASTPSFEHLALRELRLAQGDVALTGTGELAPDAQGFLAGTVTLTAENWRGLLDMLETAGLLPLDRRAFLEGALEQLAQGKDRIEVPVTFRNGKVEALGLTLLQAPRVR